MTAVPGLGALPGTPGRPGLAEPPPEEPPEGEEDEGELCTSLSCCEKGSLLAKRLNDASWPSWTVGAAATSEPEASVVVAPGASAPRKVGAARVGAAATGFPPFAGMTRGGSGGGCSCFQSFGP